MKRLGFNSKKEKNHTNIKEELFLLITLKSVKLAKM